MHASAPDNWERMEGGYEMKSSVMTECSFGLVLLSYGAGRGLRVRVMTDVIEE
jgi:hypothetical protein